MTKLKKKGFTLIELIAVLVIMAILALIVTPLVMNIIRKARISADKRSIDAYGRSIELAIAGYLLDTGKFPTQVSQLTIEYSGDTVTCETTQINPDSSVYLAGCKVKNRTVEGYVFGKDLSPSYEAYSLGDEVTYNGVDYYVLKDSDSKNNIVTLLKATPLSTEEVNLYGGVGTENNVVNKYAIDDNNYPNSVGAARNNNGYGGMAYHESENCYYKGRGSFEISGCKIDYNSSSIKKVVDSWTFANINKTNLRQTRLIKYGEDIFDDDVIEYEEQTPTAPNIRHKFKNDFFGGYSYWTETSYLDYREKIWIIKSNSLSQADVADFNYTVRPVVELYKNDGITRKNNGNN